MKLIHRTITALGIATLLGGINHTVQAQTAIEETPTLIAQMNSSGSYNRGPGSFNRGNFNRGPGSFNQGNFNRGPGSFNRGNFNRGPGGFNQGNFNPGGDFNQRDYKREVKDLNQVIFQNPKLVDAYNRRALARFVLGDKKGAIEDLQKAANLYLERGDKNRYQQTLISIRELQQ